MTFAQGLATPTEDVMTQTDNPSGDQALSADRAQDSSTGLVEIRWRRHLITSVLIALIPASYVFWYSWNYAQDMNSRSTAVAAVAYGFYVFVIFFIAIACFFLGTDWLRIHRRDD